MNYARPTVVLCALLAVCGCRSEGQERPTSTATAPSHSGPNQVAALVHQLASESASPYAAGRLDRWSDADFHCTDRVSNALRALKKMGPSIFPALVAFRDDKRYAYTAVSAAAIDRDVGDAVVQVLCDGHYMHSGYKWRDVPGSDRGAGYLSFEDYLDSRGWEKWADWAKTRSRLQIQIDFIEWCVAEEARRGYVDEAQKQRILGSYARGRNWVKKAYSEHAHAAERVLPPASRPSTRVR